MANDPVFQAIILAEPFSQQGINFRLKMLVAAIDFRSLQAAAHTTTATIISWNIAKLLGSSVAVVHSGLLHD